MTRTERMVAQDLADSISKQSALLKSLGFDMSDVFDTLRDINDVLMTEPTSDIGPLPSFEEHLAYVRESVFSGGTV